MMQWVITLDISILAIQTKGNNMKAPYILTMCLGDTYIDVHGDYDQIEEIYIADTDHEIYELVHSLNWDKFKDSFKENYYYSQRA